MADMVIVSSEALLMVRNALVDFESRVYLVSSGINTEISYAIRDCRSKLDSVENEKNTQERTISNLRLKIDEKEKELSWTRSSYIDAEARYKYTPDTPENQTILADAQEKMNRYNRRIFELQKELKDLEWSLDRERSVLRELTRKLDRLREIFDRVNRAAEDLKAAVMVFSMNSGTAATSNLSAVKQCLMYIDSYSGTTLL